MSTTTLTVFRGYTGVFLHLQGSVLLVGPLTHGTVVVLGILESHQLQDEVSVRRTDAALSIGVHSFVRGYAHFAQDGENLLRRLELVGVPVHHIEPL